MIALESKFDSKNLSDWYNNINFYIIHLSYILHNWYTSQVALLALKVINAFDTISKTTQFTSLFGVCDGDSNPGFRTRNAGCSRDDRLHVLDC